MACIGRLPDTLADRCILIRIQRKCLRFVLDHAPAIAAAEPDLPPNLNNRDDFQEAFQRYIPRHEALSLLEDFRRQRPEPPGVTSPK